MTKGQKTKINYFLDSN